MIILTTRWQIYLSFPPKKDLGWITFTSKVVISVEKKFHIIIVCPSTSAAMTVSSRLLLKAFLTQGYCFFFLTTNWSFQRWPIKNKLKRKVYVHVGAPLRMRFVENITTTLQKTAVPQVGRLIVQFVGMAGCLLGDQLRWLVLEFFLLPYIGLVSFYF